MSTQLHSTGTELNHIIDVFDDKTALQPISYNELLRRLGDETTKGKLKYYAQRDNTDFYLALIPNENDSFRVIYSVKPTATSTSIPDSIGRENRSVGAWRVVSIANDGRSALYQS